MSNICQIVNHPEHGPCVVVSDDKDGLTRLGLLDFLPTVTVFTSDVQPVTVAPPTSATPIFTQLQADQPTPVQADAPSVEPAPAPQ